MNALAQCWSFLLHFSLDDKEDRRRRGSMLSEDTPEGECWPAAGVAQAFALKRRNYRKVGLLDVDQTYTTMSVSGSLCQVQ